MSRSFWQFALSAVVTSRSLFIWPVWCVLAGQTGICRLLIWCFCPTCAMFAKSFYRLLGCVCSDWSRVDIQSHAAGGWVHSLTHSLSTNTSGFLKKSPSGQNKTFPPVIHWAKYWERSVVFARPLLDLLLLQSGAAWEVTAARPHDRSHSDNPLLYRVA